MTLLRRLLIRPGGGGVGVLCPDDEEILCIVSSTYNLCSTVPNEELTAQPTSTYYLCIDDKEFLIVSPASTYSLATAPT